MSAFRDNLSSTRYNSTTKTPLTMQLGSYRTTLCALLLLAASLTAATAQQPRANGSVSAIPTNVLLRIMRAEDERRWDNTLPVFLLHKEASVRKRAALAAGRIGDERARPALIAVLKTESDNDVRQMIAFAIGEIESPAGAAALIEIVDDLRAPAELRARAVEALGKIGGALLSSASPRGDQAATPKVEDERLTKIRTAILDALKFEAGRRSMSDRQTILLGLTAVLRTRPDGAGPVVIRFLKYTEFRIVADALNTMARLRLKDGSEQVRQLLGSGDAIVRANAARVLGATEDKGAFDALLARALNDYDLRVRVSAIRALGSLKDARAAQPLVSHADGLLRAQANKLDSTNELIEIASTLGRVLQKSNDRSAIDLLLRLRESTNMHAPEVEIALARVSPERYLSDRTIDVTWRPFAEGNAELWRKRASVFQALGELANVISDHNDKAESLRSEALTILAKNSCIDSGSGCFSDANSTPYGMRAYAQFKPKDLENILKAYLDIYGGSTVPGDAISRATAAELIAELQPSKPIADTLIRALPFALRDQMNDAALAILDALAKQKNKEANEAIKTALDSSDHLIRRRAVALLKANGVGDFSDRIGTVKTRNTEADYRRAIARIGKHVTATLVTSKGSFVIEFLPEDAPLTVDNFVKLARKGYFNGITFHRVVPNFVIQGGDPRGDGNGGPGYSIRCEINEAPYERAAVGMALSGKDTGGSQWFVTHAPQPHLDGGYTVFGRVVRGMDVVDRIARGDTIRRVIVSERK
jgi:cyclophilin family peptidyl-prolyl cis-trans isomerase/HEAT repeat protein